MIVSTSNANWTKRLKECLKRGLDEYFTINYGSRTGPATAKKPERKIKSRDGSSGSAARNIVNGERLKSESNEILLQIWISLMTALKRSAS